MAVFFGMGAGETSPAGVDGKPAGAPLPKPVLPVGMRIGGVEAEILYAGAAPELVAGVLQVNARIPAVIGSGPQEAVLRVGEASSQAGVFVSVS